MSYHINPRLSLILLSAVSLLLVLMVGSNITFQVQAQTTENGGWSTVCINDLQCQTYLCQGNEPCGTSVNCDSNNECTVENSPQNNLQSDLGDGYDEYYDYDDHMDEKSKNYMDD